MRAAPIKIHRGHAPPHGDQRADPWPGDIARGFPLMSIYRFDGQYWRIAAWGPEWPATTQAKAKPTSTGAK